jgi:hypothetical protein
MGKIVESTLVSADGVTGDPQPGKTSGTGVVVLS